MPPHPPSSASTSPARRIARALRLRCPRCGGGRIRRTWFRLAERCPTCGLALERGESHDYWLGAYAINLVVAEGASVAIALAVLYTWPDGSAAEWVGGILAIVSPIAFFPFSRTLWLAWDLSFRPHEAGDDAQRR